MVRSTSRLEFKHSIISTIKDNVSTTQILERLAQLQDELSGLQQGVVNLATVNRYKSELVNRKVLKSKDLGIRAFAACCLSDILRLYAPDAPYTDKELVEIFQLFLEQFSLLQQPENGYIMQQTYLITNLLEYRSIVLITDLPNSSQLINELFEIFYAPKNAAIPEKLFAVISGLMGEIISECDSMPMSALKLVFNKFLSHKRGVSLSGLSYKKDSGLALSLGICQTYSNRLGRHFIKFYSEIMYEVLAEDEDEQEIDKDSSSYKTLVKLGRLTTELWIHAPDLVGSVIGFLYQLLNSDNELFREAATRCVSEMLKTSSLINFAVAHSDTYKLWLTKMADISSQVRHAWVSEIPQILSERSDLATEIARGLAKALIDSDHSVRLRAVRVFHELPVKRLWGCISNPAVFTGLLHLTREARPDIRTECIEAVARIYDESLQEIPRNDENKEAWEVVDSIPSIFFNLYYINDPNINMQVDRLLFERFLPLDLSKEAFVNKLLNMMANFDEKACSSFYAFNKRQEQMSVVLSKFLSFCENSFSSDVGVAKFSAEKLTKTIDWFCQGFSKEYNVQEILKVFKELNDRRLHHLIRVAIDEASNHTTVRNAITELFKRLADPELFRKRNLKIDSRFTREHFTLVIKVLVYRAASVIFNVSSLAVLLKNAGTSQNSELSLKRQLIENISVIKPGAFKGQINSLVNVIIKFDEHTSDPSATLSLAEAMRTLYKISKSNRQHLKSSDPFFFDKLEDYAKHGSIITAKYATKLLSLLWDARDYFMRIKTSILPLNLESKYLATNVLVLSEIIKSDPQLLEEESTEVVSLLIKEVLLTNKTVGDTDGQASWISDDEIFCNEANSFLAAKIFSLKLFARKLQVMALDTEQNEMTNAFIERILKLFFYLIASGGELISEFNERYYPTPSNYQSKLRCYSGLQILKLARHSTLNKFIRPGDIGKLVNLMEDESFEVRSLFIGKLKDFAGDEVISIKYLPLIFFTAYEPDMPLKSTTKMWISLTLTKENFKKGTFFERVLPRLIHSIAHHPDIEEGLQIKGEQFMSSLATATGYLVFYFHAVANPHNLSLLYYLAGRIRQYKDSLLDESVDNDKMANDEKLRNSSIKGSGIYIISELAQLILGQFKEQNTWTLSSYPGKLNLPSDLFEPFDTIEDARKNTFEVFVKPNELESLKKMISVKVTRLYKQRGTVLKSLGQKRPLTDERRPTKKGRQAEQAPIDGDDNGNDDGDNAYVPPKISTDTKSETRKSSRQKKAVDYADDNSDED
ncbi:LADA_0G12090g1_1 [Lachancea dasiensis]|uniref:LADA_0G12090g1_1 n=1 Tax=Lachancea dasiensis TaxID=1072105 RepID=A0A1G4JVD1_9SACH|nr:LADA_0G12090g1_1 [Lachancea dasiensis]